MPQKKNSTPKRPSKREEAAGDVSDSEKVIEKSSSGKNKESVAGKKPIIKKAVAKKSVTKKATSKKLATKKATTKKAVMTPVVKEISSPAVVATPPPPVTPTTNKNAMEEALRDLDKMMAEEDSVYRLGSETKIERDYGMGMGKMLETIDETIENNVSESQEKVDETMSSAEDQRLSIESILGDSDTSNEDVERVPNRLITPHRSRGSKLLLFIPVLVFVLALLLVAEGVGLFGGVGRRWTSEVLSIISSKFGQSSVQETSQPTERPSFPSVVSINVLVMAGGSEVETIFSSVMSRMIETDVQLQDTFKATGEAFSDDAKSIGVITVVNGTSRDFRFVATTRFLSEDGILFRLKEATDIPANDSVDVSVYADIAGSTGDIGPSRFTIPGLSQELQADIYGISDSLMTGGSGTVVAVSAEDITAAKEDLLDRLRVEAIDNFSLMVDEGERIAGDLITSQELEVMEPEVGTPGATFSLEVSAEFKTLVVPEKEIISLLQARMEELLLDDSDSSSFEVSEPLYAVEAYDTIGERAELRAESSVRPL